MIQEQVQITHILDVRHVVQQLPPEQPTALGADALRAVTRLASEAAGAEAAAKRGRQAYREMREELVRKVAELEECQGYSAMLCAMLAESEGDLSEGQACKLLGMDRVAYREHKRGLIAEAVQEWGRHRAENPALAQRPDEPAALPGDSCGEAAQRSGVGNHG